MGIPKTQLKCDFCDKQIYGYCVKIVDIKNRLNRYIVCNVHLYKQSTK